MNKIIEQIEKLNPEDQLEIVDTVWARLSMPNFPLTDGEKLEIKVDLKNAEEKPETMQLAQDFLSSVNKKYFPNKKYI